jgi:excisionase family DNA binding protein
MVADSPRPGPPATSGSVNLKQAAARLDVHYMTVYRYVRQGKLPATRAGTAWLVTETAITDFLARPGPPYIAPSARPEDRAVDWADRLVLCLLAGDEPAARRVVDAALASGHPAEFCYIDMLTVVATRVVAHLGVLAHRPGRSRGTIVFGAPSGELHSLPISIAADLVRLAGFDVLELGANVPPKRSPWPANEHPSSSPSASGSPPAHGFPPLRPRSTPSARSTPMFPS